MSIYRIELYMLINHLRFSYFDTLPIIGLLTVDLFSYLTILRDIPNKFLKFHWLLIANITFHMLFILRSCIPSLLIWFMHILEYDERLYNSVPVYNHKCIQPIIIHLIPHTLHIKSNHHSTDINNDSMQVSTNRGLYEQTDFNQCFC